MYFNVFRELCFGAILLSSSACGVTATAVSAVSTVYEYVPCPTGGLPSGSGDYAGSGTSPASKSGIPSAVVAAQVDAVQSTPSATTAAPVATLTPALHPDHNPYDVNHLAPSDSARLFFAEPPASQSPSAKSQFANVITNFTNPSVVLDHSAHIQGLTCAASLSDVSATELKMSFATNEAYFYAKNSWISSNLVFVTYASGCGTSTDQRSFWATKSVSFRDECLCVTIIAVEIHFKDCVTDMDIEWGTYSPSNNTTAASGSTGSSGAPYSNVTSPASNGTYPSASTKSDNSTCGAPPSKMIDGFPTAPCGPGFDHNLDDALGYMTINSKDVAASLKEFVPNLNSTFINYITSSGSIGKRFDILGAIGNAINSVGNAIGNVIDHKFNPTLEKVIDVDVHPQTLVHSPWGDAAELFSLTQAATFGLIPESLTIWCVDCGFQTKVDITGRATVSVLSGLSACTINMKGDVHAGLGIGIDANIILKKSLIKPIFSTGLPGFSVPNIISIGPLASFSAELDFELRAVGQLLAEIQMDIKNFDTTLDVLNPAKSFSNNFSPEFTHKFNATGEISLSAEFGLPFKLGVGLAIPIISLDKSIGIVERPGVNATAEFTGSTEAAALATMSCPNGVTLSCALQNDLFLDIFGFAKINIIPRYQLPLAETCIKLPLPVFASTSATTRTATLVTSTKTSSTATSSSTSLSHTSSSSSSSSTSITLGSTGLNSRSISSSTSSTSSSATSITTSSDFQTGKGNVFYSNSTTYTSSSSTMSSIGMTSSATSATSKSSTTMTSASSIATTTASTSVTTSASTTTSTSTILPTGPSYVRIVSTTSSDQLSASSDGDFYLTSSSSSSSLFTSYANATASDSQNRIFHFHPTMMDAYGVSRFRLSAFTSLPKTSEIMSLTSLDHDDDASTPDILIAADIQGGSYHTVVCAIQGEVGVEGKVFVVKDVESGIKMLKTQKAMWTVTGGVVGDCREVRFMAVPEGHNLYGN